MPAHFEDLRERLLRAGVAPRHATRYLTELTEHLEDLSAEERLAGCDDEAAQRSALARLGDIDSLAKTMIDRKEFRSWSHRVPWAVYFLGPLAAVFAFNFLSLLLLALVLEFYGSGAGQHPMPLPAWLIYTKTSNFNLFLLPLLFGWAISFLAVRQKVKPEWPIVGLVGVAVFCGLQTYHIEWSPVPNGVTNISVGWAFLPGHAITLAAGVRLVLNLMLTLTLFTLWRSWRLHRERLEKVERNHSRRRVAR
jgi:hypothetical protein